MCQPKGTQIYTGLLGCTCGCCGCGCGPTFRRYFSSKEELECLAAHEDQLKKELDGIEERIKELKGK